jgi:hypothetical protein
VRLVAGEPFDVVATQLSERAPGTGDLGWIHEDRLAAWMKGKLGEAVAGDVTQVIEADFGCNVLQIVDRRPYQEKGYVVVRAQLHDRLFGERMQREYLKFMDKLREQTYIERKGVFATAPPVGAGNGGWSSGPDEDPSGF